MTTRMSLFTGAWYGAWRIAEIRPVRGETLPDAPALAISPGSDRTYVEQHAWCLRGITSNERYVTRAEKTELAGRQPELGRSTATHAALIPIRKSARWWGLTQDERRSILEETSRHIQIGLRYLPAIARRLYHCRDVSDNEPFDFLTWFEFAPQAEAAFNELTQALRATPEWGFVEREVDIRLVSARTIESDRTAGR